MQRKTIETIPVLSDAIKNILSAFLMPPYSPDLNPIEQVWRITRSEKHINDISLR